MIQNKTNILVLFESLAISSGLEDNPRPQGVERLEAKEKLYRMYVGPGKDYRAINQIRDEILVVLGVRVGDRKDVYRNLK